MCENLKITSFLRQVFMYMKMLVRKLKAKNLRFYYNIIVIEYPSKNICFTYFPILPNFTDSKPANYFFKVKKIII